MENNIRKYILIPEYRPLWAMRKCFGPTHGPLTKPCPTPLDIIRELLLQTGREELTIMEVVKEGDKFSEPVRLTIDNYMLPYEEIRGGKTVPVTEVIVVDDKPKVEVAPTFVDKPIDPPTTEPEPGEFDDAAPSTDSEPAYSAGDSIVEPEQGSTADSDDSVASDDETPTETIIVEDSTEEAATPAEAIANQISTDGEEMPEATETVTSTVDPYAGMTKSQRRAARKAAEAEAAKNNQ